MNDSYHYAADNYFSFSPDDLSFSNFLIHFLLQIGQIEMIFPSESDTETGLYTEKVYFKFNRFTSENLAAVLERESEGESK